MIRVFFGVPKSYGNSDWASLGHTGKGEKGPKGGRAPPLALVRIGLGKGGAPFLPSFSFSLPFPSLLLPLHGRTPSWTRKGGILLPVGVGLPLARPNIGRPPPSLAPLYMGAGGTP